MEVIHSVDGNCNEIVCNPFREDLRATKMTSHFKQFNCIIHSVYLKQIVIKVLSFKLCILQLSFYLYFYSKNGKLQKRGKVNLVGRLQLSTERSKEEDNECIVQLRIFRVQVSCDYVTCMLLHI
jgi:hypothetical protein